ncbi:MAG: nucleotidyltransferase [Candidatus Bathyarchaeota archaeon]|nr:nucleotidyltransferase [Candidatus Bathyarchaeota archaeon]
MPAILRSLQRLVALFEKNRIDYMIIGGYALPFYGRIRTTVDLDLAVAVKTKDAYNALLNLLRAADFEPTICSPNNPLTVIVDHKEGMEFELWSRPDGIVFDQETLTRRNRMQLSEDFSAWVVSPEDFIVTKLARPDRGVIDEQDLKSVLVRQEGKLDLSYLTKRAQDAQVLTILRTIQNA